MGPGGLIVLYLLAGLMVLCMLVGILVACTCLFRRYACPLVPILVWGFYQNRDDLRRARSVLASRTPISFKMHKKMDFKKVSFLPVLVLLTPPTVWVTFY